MKKLFVVLIITFWGNISAIQLTLINNKTIRGQLQMFDKNDYYISNEKDLYIINKEVTVGINLDLSENIEDKKPILYTSYENIHTVNNQNIWRAELFVDRAVKGFTLNQKKIKASQYTPLKIVLENNKHQPGRFLNDSENHLLLFDDKEFQVEKQKIVQIWRTTENNNKIYIGRAVGGLLGCIFFISLHTDNGIYSDYENVWRNSLVASGSLFLLGSLVDFTLNWGNKKDKLIYQK